MRYHFGLSFLSIFIYISIFYIFNLSPFSLINTTKFWFLVSNTLILIIAADFGAFSSRKEADFYEVYAKNSQANSIPSFESQYWEIVKTSIPPQKEENSQESQEKNKKVCVAVVHKSKSLENELKVIVKDDPNQSNERLRKKMSEFTPKADNHEACSEKKKQNMFVACLVKIFQLKTLKTKIFYAGQSPKSMSQMKKKMSLQPYPMKNSIEELRSSFKDLTGRFDFKQLKTEFAKFRKSSK